jgi:hypothetical protein
VCHGVTATATYANYLDLGALVKRFVVNQFNGHVLLLKIQMVLGY